MKLVEKSTSYIYPYFYRGLCYFLTLKIFGMLIRTKIYFLFALFLNLISIDKENDNVLQVINFYQHFLTAIWLSTANLLSAVLEWGQLTNLILITGFLQF